MRFCVSLQHITKIRLAGLMRYVYAQLISTTRIYELHDECNRHAKSTWLSLKRFHALWIFKREILTLESSREIESKTCHFIYNRYVNTVYLMNLDCYSRNSIRNCKSRNVNVIRSVLCPVTKKNGLRTGSM